MANMKLGAYTFVHNPSEISELLTPELSSSTVKTYTSIAHFSWGSRLVGKPVVLRWEYMTTGQYTSLQGLLVADNNVAFDPTDGSNKTYLVKITSLRGTMHVMPATGHRKDVELAVVLLDEGAAIPA